MSVRCQLIYVDKKGKKGNRDTIMTDRSTHELKKDVLLCLGTRVRNLVLAVKSDVRMTSKLLPDLYVLQV